MINKNIITTVALVMASSFFQAKAQTDISVSGTVKDVYGNPVPGVIVSSNHNDVYVTDKDGSYAATVTEGDNLTFSMLGYKQKTEKAASNAEIVLEDDAHALAEIVNIGYMRQYREVLTDAVSSVSGAELGKSLMPRLQGTFSGKFSGLTTIENSFEPAYEDLSMYIRGFSTIHGGTAAVVIDGIIYDNYSNDILYRISPEEIESVSILKDGASQAIFGLNGANGLIVINTKRGAPGKLKVGVSISETVEQPTENIHCFDSYRYATLRNQAGFNDGRGDNVFFSDETLQGLKNGGNDLYPNTNWHDMLVRDYSTQQRVALNAAGGSSKMTFFSNLNVLRQGSFWNTDQSDYSADNEKYRINFRSNIDLKIKKWIKVYLNLSGSVVNAHTPGTNIGGNASIYELAASMPSTIYGPVTPQVTDDQGNAVDKGGNVTTSVNMAKSPYGELNRTGYNNQTNTNIYGQGGINLNLSFITPGLWAGGSVGYLSYDTSTMTTNQTYSKYYRDDDWSSLKFTMLGTDLDTDLSYGKSTALYSYLSYKAEVGYQRDFGSHHISGDAFATYQDFDDGTGNWVSPSYDYRRDYAGIEVAYDYAKRYAVKLSTGYSGSDFFPKDTRFIWTPGISAGWIASNEDFIKNNAPWLSLLKIRGSYAVTGNDNTGFDRYAYTDQVTSSLGGLIKYLDHSTKVTAYGNSDLQPEKIRKWNAGIDLGIADQLTVSFDIFGEKLNNGVYKSTSLIPIYQGINLNLYPITNLAKFKNNGWELNVGYNKRLNADWSLNFSGHLDYNKNKVVYIGESPKDDTYAYKYRQEGYPYGQSFGYIVDKSNGNGFYNFQDEIEAGPVYSFGSPRLGDLKFKDLNNDGTIDEKDKAPVGDGILPHYSFGLTAGFSFKAFEVSLLFQGVADYQRNYLELITGQSKGDGVYTESHLNAWTPEKWLDHKTIEMPALSTTTSTSYQNNDFLVKDASFVRLKNVVISYKMPKKVCDFLSASAFKVYLSGQNLFTLDKMDTNDMPVEGDYLAFPVYRMYRIGIDLTF